MTVQTPIRPYPVPVNDLSRSRITDAMELEKRRSDPFFTHVTDVVRGIFDTPVAFLSLLSGDHLTFLCMNGIDMTGTPRTHSLCAFTVAKGQTIILPDTLLDPRTADHPVVAGPPHVRFSASAPVILSSGFCIGTLCAIDLVPREAPGETQVRQLEHLAAMVARFYEVPLEPDPAQLARLNRIAADAQEEFLTLIGHELRTPLNGIQGLAQVLEPANEDQAELIAILLESASHLEKIVESILTFTDLRTGDIALPDTLVDIGALLGGVMHRMGRLAGLNGKHLNTGALPDGMTLKGDPALLELGVTCLLLNFIAHGGPTGHISLREDPGGDLTLEILDDGAGIPEDRIAGIWQAFAVGARPTERASDGIGLGLPLTRRIVELHGGELDVVRHNGQTLAQIRLPAWRRG